MAHGAPRVPRREDAMSKRRQSSNEGPAEDPASLWPPGQRQRNREVKREAVIRAAAQAFNARGYHNTSLDDIAAALGVTKPTVYYYVNNKEQLLFECFRHGLQRIQDAFRAVEDRRLPGRERLREVVIRYAEAIASEFGWCMVRAHDQDLSPEMAGQIRALKSDIDQGLRRLIREGIADGSIGPCDPKATAFALAGALNWIAHWYRPGQGMDPSQVGESFMTVFERGLMPRG
jgi:AcrR family transcriptional regulator